MSLISVAFTHFPSSGIGAGPWLGPFATQTISSTALEKCIVNLQIFYIRENYSITVKISQLFLSCL
jgi:hypothetical protein